MPTVDTINGTAAADTITFTATSTTVNAGEGANTITGTSGDNEIYAGAGADTITVTSGNNTIDAGGGANTITATTGNNTITTGAGADTITLTSGDNTIDAGDGANTITATSGNNTITSGAGVDTVTVTSGNNTIDVGDGANTVTATWGDNEITGGDGIDTVTTGDGNNIIWVGDGANTVTTGAGVDQIYTGVDIDTVTSGAGDDEIHILGGTDTITAGAGTDTLFVDFSAAAGAVTMSALAGTASAGYAGNISGIGVATFAGVENFDITSGSFNDVITTGDGTDVVHAGGGNDTVNLAGGNDEAIYTMAANAGAIDVYQGGAGVDTLTLELTTAEWFSAAVQADIADYLVFLAAHTNPITGEADSVVFQFTAFDLSASEFEALNVIVDGVVLDPTDEAVTAVADTATVNEDDTATSFGSVLGNDIVPDLAKSVSLFSTTSSGSLTFNAGTVGAPDGTFSFDPLNDFDYLADGESTTVSFVYEVEDADGDTDQATVTITVTGTNDAPVAVDDTITAGRILFVSDSGVGSDIATVLTNAGHEVDVVLDNFTNGSTLALTGDLSGYSAIYWSASGDAYGNNHTDTAMFANLESFASNGGSVFITGYDSIASPTDSQLISFLGGTSSYDFGEPSTGTMGANSLTTGVIDIQGVQPAGYYGDTDTLFVDSGAGTQIVVGSSYGGTGASWSLRSMGTGEIAYVSNGIPGTTGSEDGWTDTSAGGYGAYNAALLNFAFAAQASSGVLENSIVSIDTATLLANDTDVDQTDFINVTNVSNDNGTSTVVLSGNMITYDPNGEFDYLSEGETATDTFSYTVSDGNGATDTATVSVTVTGINGGPPAGIHDLNDQSDSYVGTNGLVDTFIFDIDVGTTDGVNSLISITNFEMGVDRLVFQSENPVTSSYFDHRYRDGLGHENLIGDDFNLMHPVARHQTYTGVQPNNGDNEFSIYGVPGTVDSIEINTGASDVAIALGAWGPDTPHYISGNLISTIGSAYNSASDDNIDLYLGAEVAGINPLWYDGDILTF
jgi:Ca2+-binding RTX toxin-like protein